MANFKTNILLLAAGRGQRFLDAGYDKNKPLIEVHGVPMWRLVLDNLLEQFPEEYLGEIYIATKKEYGIDHDTYNVVNLEGPQLGAAYSALQLRDLMDPVQPLLILNVDQLVYFDTEALRELLDRRDHYHGFLMHFMEPNGETKWGRSILNNDDSTIDQIVEKVPVSPYAHTGHYFYSYTDDFINYASEMILIGDTFNDEYFISPTFNYMIDDGKTVVPFYVDRFVPLGLPEDLEKYLGD